MKPHPLVKEVAGAQEGDLSPDHRLEQGRCLSIVPFLFEYLLYPMNTSSVRTVSDANVFFTFYSLRKTSKGHSDLILKYTPPLRLPTW